MQLFVGQLLNGVIVGSLYAIVALGLTLTFGITGIVNFALGEWLHPRPPVSRQIGMTG